MKGKRKAILIVGILAVVMAAIGIGAATMGRKKDNKDEDEKKEVVRRGEFIVKVRESGTLEPLISVEVRSNVEGEIDKIYVKEGDVVEKGQPLMQIDDEQIREQHKQAEANLDARKAQWDQAKLRINMTQTQQDSAIVQARNTVKSAKAGLEALDANTLQRITEAETQIATTKNDLEQDQITLRQSDLALQQAELALERARSSETSAKIAYETADSEYKRNQELFNKKLVSKRSLEEADTRRANALSQHEAAKKETESQIKAVESQQQTIDARKEAIKSRRATLSLYEQNLGTIKGSQSAQQRQLMADLENAKTRLKQILDTTDQEMDITRHAEVSAKASYLEAESTLKAQQERLGWTTVIAAMSGTITRIVIEEGEIVTSGRSAFSQGPALMEIADLSRMVVKTRINEVEIAKIKVGQRVEIRTQSYLDKGFEGRVTEIAPSAYGQPQGGQDPTITFEVIIEVAGSEGELLPGMSADVDIVVMEQPDVLQLPIEAVIDNEIMTVKANVPSAQLSRFQSDAKVEIQTLIGKKFSGKVGKIDSTKTRGNVEILLDGSPRGLRSGPTEIHILFSETDKLQNVAAEIESERKYFVLLDKEIPATEDKGKKKDNKNKEKGVRTRIEVGQRNNSHFEILGGIVEGDRVFVPSMQELTQKR